MNRYIYIVIFIILFIYLFIPKYAEPNGAKNNS
jgi:hypothetical protein